MGFQVVIEFAFGSLYAFKATETQQVCPTNIRDHTACWLYIRDEFLYISRMTCTHFDHCYLMRCIKTQQCFRNAYIVIEVSFGVHHAITLG